METDWTTLSIDEVVRRLSVDPAAGLSPDEARKRQETAGPNILPSKPPRGILLRLADQFRETLIIILLVATAVSILLREVKDAVAIFAIVFINAVLGAVQEFKAERTLAALKSFSGSIISILRAGVWKRVAPEELVPGDIVTLGEGDKIPADVRWLETQRMAVDEAILTGESEPVKKDASFVGQPGLSPGDQRNMGFRGTNIISGKGTAVVVETGRRTHLGRIAEMMVEMEEEPTPLQRELLRLGRQISYAILGIVAALLVIGLFQHRPFLQMFMVSVSLAVAAIPEGLPAVITILLAVGVQKMAARNAIVRRLSAVEALGATTIICTDKTGTLTENRMELVKVGLADGLREGDFSVARSEIAHILRVAVLASEVRTTDRGYFGDPLDVAIRRLADKLEFPAERWLKEAVRAGEIPFDSHRKRVSFLYREDGGFFLAVKGAAEEILAKSRRYALAGKEGEMTDAKRQELLGIQVELAREGLRVLGVAQRRFAEELPQEQWEDDLTFLGFIAFLDPLREGVKEAVDLSIQAGMRPMMVTGDYVWTARKIARDLGIPADDDAVYQGTDLSHRDAFASLEWDRAAVFSRVTPEHKMEIVRNLKRKGEIVAMTGDGVNDAPALKMADIGISMGLRGTEVAREASDLVLLDDSFSTIVAAIEEGRRVFDNIRKATYYLLSCNLSEVLTVAVPILLRMPLPLTALQLLWINLITDGFPALALGMEPPSEGLMSRKPRAAGEGILTGRLWRSMVLDGLLMGIAALSVFIWALHHPSGAYAEDEARTMAFAVLVLSQLVQAFVISLRSRSSWRQALANRTLVAALALSALLQFSILLTPAGRDFFSLARLSAAELDSIILAGLIPAYRFIVEQGVRKATIRRRAARQ